MRPSKPLKRALWIAVFPCLAWAGLHAQPMPLPDAPPDPLPALLLDTPVEHYGSLDLTGLSPAQWKTFVAFHTALLEDGEAESRIASMRNIIHFAKNYGEVVNFRTATDELYEIFRFERDDTERIYAITALHAIGDEDSMRRLAEAHKWERSERVRRMIRVAVNDYFTRVNA